MQKERGDGPKDPIHQALIAIDALDLILDAGGHDIRCWFPFHHALPCWRRHGAEYIQRERLPIPTMLSGMAAGDGMCSAQARLLSCSDIFGWRNTRVWGSGLLHFWATCMP
jgi:hypothetical protein